MEHSPKTSYWTTYLNNPEETEKTIADLANKYDLTTVAGQILANLGASNKVITSLILNIAQTEGEAAEKALLDLQARGLPLDLGDEEDGVTALHKAAGTRSPLAVQRLFALGVPINIPTQCGDTPFDWGAQAILARRPASPPNDLTFLRLLVHLGATGTSSADLWAAAKKTDANGNLCDPDLHRLMLDITGPACRPQALQAGKNDPLGQCHQLNGLLSGGAFKGAADDRPLPQDPVLTTISGEATAPKHFGWEQTALQNQQ